MTEGSHVLAFLTSQEGLSLAFLLAFGLAIGWARLRQGDRRSSALRDIPAFGALKHAVSRSVESGKPIHVGLGVGGVSTEVAADNLAALEIVDAVVQDVGLAEETPIITLADATLLPLVENRVRHVSGVRGRVENVRWIGPGPTTYAAGAMEVLGSQKLGYSILAGVFGDEYLLIGGAGCQSRIRQVGAVSEPGVLPGVYSTADDLLMGEELYASGAYLSEKPWHLASLVGQDRMRWVLVLAIVGVLIARLLW